MPSRAALGEFARRLAHPSLSRRLSHARPRARRIGRITRGLLLDVAKRIDVVEPISKFTEALHGIPGVRDIENVGLEKWHPKPGRRYDLVWVQWCVGHLTDNQLVQLLVRCRDALNPRGLVVIKENLSTTGADVFDEEDSSVTRSEREPGHRVTPTRRTQADEPLKNKKQKPFRHDNTFRDIFQKAGFQIKKTELQRGFPSNSEMTLLPVRMYALQPKSTTTDGSTS